VILVLLAVLAGLAAWIVPQLLADPPPERVPVPSVVGLTQAEAERAIVKAGLTVGTIDPQPDDTVEAGLVVSQDPGPDIRVEADTPVDLVVSTGRAEVVIPASILGEKKNAAKKTLEALKLDVVLRERKSDEPAGTVIESDPPVGTSVAEGSTVTVFYSAGPAIVEDVVGKNVDVATQILENQGFTVKVFEDDSPTDLPVGTVLEQTPPAGEPQPQGTQIVLLVTSYVAPPPPSDTPTDSPSGSPSTSPSGSPPPSP
jgi:serine/threonine-protein kinase